MSWKPEVQTDSSGKWYPNALAFATKEEADEYAADLASRWVLVNAWRSVESTQEVNYAYVDDVNLLGGYERKLKNLKP